MPDKYYFIVYENRPKHLGNYKPIVSNVVVKNIHPLIWASQPQGIIYKEKYITFIHFYSSIPEHIAKQIEKENYISTEYDLWGDKNESGKTKRRKT